MPVYQSMLKSYNFDEEMYLNLESWIKAKKQINIHTQTAVFYGLKWFLVM